MKLRLTTMLAFIMPVLASYPQNSLPRPDHIVIVMFENASYEVVIQQKVAKYICKLAEDSNTALLANSYALMHPSQPNYIMLFSGDNHGVANDSMPANLPFTGPNLAVSLQSRGFSFCGYAEDLPATGYAGERSGSYVRKHCPWINWQGSEGENAISSECSKPYKEFPKDFSKLPTLSFVIPNMNHDMHDPPNTFGAITTGDKWLKKNLDDYIEWAKANNSLLIITFDEDDNHNRNHIPTLLVGQMIKGGIYDQYADHYSILRTITDMYGLEPVGKGKNAEALKNCWK